MADMYTDAGLGEQGLKPTGGDEIGDKVGKILEILYGAREGTFPLTTSGSSAPTVTASKTLVNTSSGGTIPTGFISAQLQVGSGATVVIDGITLTAGQTITYPPASKLYPSVTYTISGGSLVGYYIE